MINFIQNQGRDETQNERKGTSGEKNLLKFPFGIIFFEMPLVLVKASVFQIM